MAKCQIVYESEDDDANELANTKKTRVDNVEQPEPALGIRDVGPAQQSAHTGKGSRGQLAQMKELERIQTSSIKRPSRLDIAMQNEDLNPMAPSSQDVDGRNFRAQAHSKPMTTALIHSHDLQSTRPQPKFTFAAPGKQFGFKLPGTVAQTENRVPSTAQAPISWSHSQRSSLGGSVPGSSYTSNLDLFLTRSVASTVPTSRTPSVCSSAAPHCSSQRQDPPSQQPFASTQQQASSATARLSRTTSFYHGQPIDVSVTGHSLSAAPRVQDPQIDKISPDEDNRLAESMLYEVQNLRALPSPGNDAISLLPPDPANNNQERMSPSPDRDYVAGDTSMRHGSADIQADDHPTRGREQSNAGMASHARALDDEDVVTTHHCYNCALRLSSNSQLLATSRQLLSFVDQDSNRTQDLNGDSQDTAVASAGQVGWKNERSEPWQLHYYDPPTCNIIERAKQLSHCEATSINPFPPCAKFDVKAIEFIDTAMLECRERGLVISEGWWPQQATNILRLLWEDLGNWRLSLRKKARVYATQRYQWDPENHCEHNAEIAKNLLGNGGLFLQDSLDKEGHANNLMHLALAGLIIDFFYIGPTLVGKLFPEDFGVEVPRVTVAIAATALKVILDKISSTNESEVNFRVNTYLPIYSEILGLMSKCNTSPVHCTKMQALRQCWAELGSNGTPNHTSGVKSCSFDVDLE